MLIPPTTPWWGLILSIFLPFLAHNTLYTFAFFRVSVLLCLLCFHDPWYKRDDCRVVYSYPYPLFGRLVSLCERCLDEVK